MSQMNGIGSTQQFPATVDAVLTSSTARAAQVGMRTSAGASDFEQTSVSGTANEVARALTRSDVRVDRVTELQGAIAAGTYNVPAADVAAKLLGSLMN